jgi:hypothetical protein
MKMFEFCEQTIYFKRDFIKIQVSQLQQGVTHSVLNGKAATSLAQKEKI